MKRRNLLQSLVVGVAALFVPELKAEHEICCSPEGTKLGEDEMYWDVVYMHQGNKFRYGPFLDYWNAKRFLASVEIEQGGEWREAEEGEPFSDWQPLYQLRTLSMLRLDDVFVPYHRQNLGKSVRWQFQKRQQAEDMVSTMRVERTIPGVWPSVKSQAGKDIPGMHKIEKRFPNREVDGLQWLKVIK